ncbi:MAG: RHS repeat protein, partial [Gammaproteobacteria bacterium]|nr:RHS repeat protein [Gammaproteobacteria bacterium]
MITAIIKDGKFGYNLPPDKMRKVTEYDAFGNIEEEKCEYVGERMYRQEEERMTFVIRPSAGGYRWEDKRGNWKQYAGNTNDENEGRLFASGNRRGTTETVLYGAENKVIGYADKNGAQIFWIEYDAGTGLVSAVRDAADRRVEYTYYADGKLNTVKDVLGYVTTYTYNAEGKITKVSKPGGREVNVAYTAYGDVLSVLNSKGQGHTFEFDYDTQKEEYYAMVRSTSGLIKEYWYDEDGETKRIDINGTTVQTIEKDGNALIITDERRLETRKEYDEWDNPTKIIYPDSSTVSYQYEHTYNQRTREVNELGIVTEYEYDNDGNLIKQIEAKDTDVERVMEFTYYPDRNLETIQVWLDETTVAVTTMEYDTADNIITITDPENNVMHFTSYDFMGNVLSMLDGRGKTRTFTYDDMGRLRKITNPLTHTTEHIYNAAGNLAQVIDPNTHATTYRYDHQDNLIEIEDADHKLTRFEYNDDGNLLRQIDPEGRQIAYVYDTYGRQVTITDGNGNDIRMEYDDVSGSSCSSCSGGATNLLSKIIYPTFTKEFRYDKRGRKIAEIDHVNGETLTTSFEYDLAGNLISTTDKEAHTSTYAYDALNRLVTATDSMGPTSSTYNALGNLTSLTDAENQTTTFDYDKNGRLKKEFRPLPQGTGFIEYGYDGAGNLITKRDANNQLTEYLYDDAGRLEHIRYEDKTVALMYDNAGNLKTYDDGVTSATYNYNALNRKTSETVNYGTFSKTFTYDYYANSLKKTFTMPDNTTYGYTYDNNNQLARVSLPGAGEITYPSYTWNRPNSVVFPGGSKQEYRYDPLMRITQITAEDPGHNVLLDYQYTYDKMDNIRSKQTEQGTYNYTYDALSRLTDVTVDIPDVNDEAFTYDKVGNRKTEAGIEGEWNYTLNNELLGYADLSYTYDENGNMTQVKLSDA